MTEHILELALIASIGAAVLAGISWNTLGIWQKYRADEKAKVDWGKVQKNVVIGAVLGIIAFGVGLTDVLPIPIITGLGSFIGATIAFFPLIVIAEKIFTKKG